MDRADLHRLIDTLPEGALENAKQVLDHLQVWPPQRSPEMNRMREIRKEQMERMRQSIRPGTIGGMGGGGSFNPTTGYGHSGHTHWEYDTAVQETHHFFKGHEIAVTERLSLINDGKAIHYTHEVRGPKSEPASHETTLDVE